MGRSSRYRLAGAGPGVRGFPLSQAPGRANPAGYGDEAFNGVLGFTQVFTNGFDLHTGFEGLSPGYPYYFAIEAVNGHDGRTLLSPEFEVLPDTAPFTVSPQRAIRWQGWPAGTHE